MQLAPTFSISLCAFTEKALKILLKSFAHSWRDEQKATLFQVFHLSVVIHYPNGLANDMMIGNSSDGGDPALWHKLLEGMSSCLEMQIKKNSRRIVTGEEYICSNEFAEIYASILIAVSDYIIRIIINNFKPLFSFSFITVIPTNRSKVIIKLQREPESKH